MCASRPPKLRVRKSAVARRRAEKTISGARLGFSPSEPSMPLRRACCQRRAFLMLCLPGWLVGSVYPGGDGGIVADALLSAPACVTDDGWMDGRRGLYFVYRFACVYMRGAAHYALIAGYNRCGLRHCSARDRLCMCGRMVYYGV